MQNLILLKEKQILCFSENKINIIISKINSDIEKIIKTGKNRYYFNFKADILNIINEVLYGNPTKFENDIFYKYVLANKETKQFFNFVINQKIGSKIL